MPGSELPGCLFQYIRVATRGPAAVTVFRKTVLLSGPKVAVTDYTVLAVTDYTAHAVTDYTGAAGNDQEPKNMGSTRPVRGSAAFERNGEAKSRKTWVRYTLCEVRPLSKKKTEASVGELRGKRRNNSSLL